MKKAISYNQGFGREANIVSNVPRKAILQRNLKYLKQQKVVDFGAYVKTKQQLTIAQKGE